MILRALGALMALLLFFSVGLQYNDPDPVQWMAFYGSAGLIAAWAAVAPSRYPWPLPAAVALWGLIWAAMIGPDFWGQIPLRDMFRSWEMDDILVEEARETFGLLITASWMAVLTAARLWERHRPAAAAPTASPVERPPA